MTFLTFLLYFIISAAIWQGTLFGIFLIFKKLTKVPELSQGRENFPQGKVKFVSLDELEEMVKQQSSGDNDDGNWH